MARINVLDQTVAELIAAGEVVERPAAVVKELVENAIDAGGRNISVEISGGGIRLIRISDDGCGIAKDDIPRAFMRHATSKVCKAEDLDEIMTLGFRGEALASVAAMCRVELATRTDDDEEGTVYTIEGGSFMGSGPVGRPRGTTIAVRDIFFNTPARMKFLKKDVSEGNAVEQVVERCMLSHPEIAFRFVRDGQLKLKSSGSGELLPVIAAVFGREISGGMRKVDYALDDSIRVEGYVTDPASARASRQFQVFFINGRYVKTKTAAAALDEAFKGKLQTGRFAACVLNIALSPGVVDVNVHPAKIEVRFANERPVFSAVYYAVKSAIAAAGQPDSGVLSPELSVKLNAFTLRETPTTYDQPRIASSVPVFAAPEAERKNPLSRPLSLRSPSIDIEVDEEPMRKKLTNPRFSDKISLFDNDKIIETVAAKTENSPTNNIEAAPQADAEDFRVIGEALGTYILLELGDSIVLIDKHAAHERILYERLRRDISLGNRQVLLVPQTVPMDQSDRAALLEHPEAAEKLGFMIEDFGGSLMVREIPLELAQADVEQILSDLAAKLRRGSFDYSPAALDKLLFSIACRSAIKARDKNNPEELREIARLLRDDPSITHCPHGRPVRVRLSRRELEKMFGRLV